MRGNSATGGSYGGGVYQMAGSTTLRNFASVTGNTATLGGGIYYTGGTVVLGDLATVAVNVDLLCVVCIAN